MLKTKEQLLYYFNGQNIKLSTYDVRFCQNLQYLIAKNNYVTTNQKELFEKLISKYKKQISQAGIDVNSCKQLPWVTNIIQSEEKYTGAQVSMDRRGENIIVKVPFNKKFITCLREENRNHNLEWVRAEKYYVSPLTTTALKFLVNELPKYFSTVTFDSKLQNFIDKVRSYSAKIYNPTLVKVHNNYIIAAINNELYESTKQIELNDDPKTLFLLSQYGVTVDEDIIKDDKKKLFASTVVVNVDVSDLNDVLNWLHEFDIDMVYLGGRFSTSSTIMLNLTKIIKGKSYNKKVDNLMRNMKRQLGKLNIKYKNNSEFFKDQSVDRQPVVVQFMQGVEPTMCVPGKRITKFIVIVDSSPIDSIEVVNETS